MLPRCDGSRCGPVDMAQAQLQSGQVLNTVGILRCRSYSFSVIDARPLPICLEKLSLIHNMHPLPLPVTSLWPQLIPVVTPIIGSSLIWVKAAEA